MNVRRPASEDVGDEVAVSFNESQQLRGRGVWCDLDDGSREIAFRRTSSCHPTEPVSGHDVRRDVRPPLRGFSCNALKYWAGEA